MQNNYLYHCKFLFARTLCQSLTAFWYPDGQWQQQGSGVWRDELGYFLWHHHWIQLMRFTGWMTIWAQSGRK